MFLIFVVDGLQIRLYYRMVHPEGLGITNNTNFCRILSQFLVFFFYLSLSLPRLKPCATISVILRHLLNAMSKFRRNDRFCSNGIYSIVISNNCSNWIYSIAINNRYCINGIYSIKKMSYHSLRICRFILIFLSLSIILFIP